MTSPVRSRGTDSSGRPIYASDKLWAVWLRILADKRLADFDHLIVITQGSWMSLVGGGAKASAGVHDKGGCFDIRTRTLTPVQIAVLVKVIREHAGAAYLRNMDHGGFKDPHIHVIFGFDDDLAPAASRQWTAYLQGRDGLRSNGPDYHPRPTPLVTKPPRPTPKPKPPRAGVLRARLYFAAAKRMNDRGIKAIAKSKDPALVKARAEAVETSNRIARTRSQMPTK
jgi:hypothetical protein